MLIVTTIFSSLLVQGIIDYTGTEIRQVFFVCYSCKYFKGLFTPTFNGIAVSVWCVSSKPVVLKAGLDN